MWKFVKKASPDIGAETENVSRRIGALLAGFALFILVILLVIAGAIIKGEQ